MRRLRIRTEAALISAASVTVVALLAPPGGDAAAHLYRTELVREGVFLWDNLWFGGHYPLASYSVLYYLLAAAIGNEALVALAGVASATLFASIVDSRWPARAYAVLAATPLYTGTYSYAVGIAAALAAVRLLQLGRRRPAVLAGLVTLGFAPLAFVFLCIAVAAAAVARRRWDWLVAGSLLAAALLELAVLLLFPSEGLYLFSPISLGATLVVAALGFALPRRTALGWFFALWALVAVVAFAVPSPFGDNLTRLRMMVFPLVLLAAVRAGFRPRWLAVPAVVLALGYNIAPDLSALPKRLDDTKTASAAFWAPAVALAEGDPNHRVEVVPTFGHWEAYWVPRAGVALARGWYRQIDLVENEVLYEDPLDPEEYRAWLRRNAVSLVLVPEARLGPLGASREADLVRDSFEEVFRSENWRVFAVPDPAPILEGGRLTRLTHEEIAGTTEAGVHLLRVRWTPYWQADGPVCLERAAGGLTLLRAERAGPFVLRSSFPGSVDCRR